MKVILLQDVKKQGKKGQVIEVSDGYGRNYLIKNKLAQAADQGAMKQLEAKHKADERQAAEDLKEAKQLKEKIEQESTVVEIKAKTGDDGRLFGTIPSKQIAQELANQHGIEVDKRKIQLDENIAALGHYQVPIKLHHDVQGHIRLHVVEE